MKHSLHISRLPGSIVAFALVVGLAAPVVAEGLRVPVGDLSRPAAAQNFKQHLDSAAHRFCWARYRPMELDKIAACESAIREEGLAALTPEQREALAHSLGADHLLASAGR